MSLRSRAWHTLNGRVHPRVLAGLGSIYLSARFRRRCAVRYDDGAWIHRYRDGVVVDTRPGGLTPRMRDRRAREVFLYGYLPEPGDTVVDVGAGVGGEVGLFSRLVGGQGRVVGVEAHPATFRCLDRMVALNGLTNVTPVQCAVVARAGPVRLCEDPVGHIRNALTTDPGRGVEVAGRTLDELVASLGLGRIDLLKMNIEGAERDVLAGARDLPGTVRHLTVSCHDFLADGPDRHWQRTFASVTALLRESGYEIRTRPADLRRPWLRYYVYASRPEQGARPVRDDGPAS